MINGIINVYKEKGFTSHDVVAKLRGILHQKKIGHTGTLDPDATGVLLVCLGKATKLCDMLTDKSKTYESVMRFGISTNTQDISGEIIEKSDKIIPYEDIISAIKSFVGEYEQVPPMYSALKVNGKKLYEYAREGITIERKPRKVTIYDIVIKSVNFPLVTFEVSCSKGTYIRTLCEDIGKKLNCPACMQKLTRTKVSDFSIENALTLDEIQRLVLEDKIDEYIIQTDRAFDNLKMAVVKGEFEKTLYNGNYLYTDSFIEEMTDERIRVYDTKQNFTGIYKYSEQKHCYIPEKMFLGL